MLSQTKPSDQTALLVSHPSVLIVRMYPGTQLAFLPPKSADGWHPAAALPPFWQLPVLHDAHTVQSVLSSVPFP